MQSVPPADAIEMYISDKQTELADATIYSHRSRLSHFEQWTSEQDHIDTLADIEPIDPHRYKQWRREEGGVNNVTLKTQLDTLRVWLRWAEQTGLAPDGISDAVLSPTLSKGENAREEHIDPDVAEVIEDRLSTFEYASRPHVVFELIWRGLLRRGAVRAIDLQDVNLSGENPHIEIHHRPETGTPLKNKEDGERTLAIKPKTARVIEDYIDEFRSDVADKHGREPLITTSQGRPHVQTVQSTIYAVTRPCTVTECPHDRDPGECDAARNKQRAYECPSSVSPHPVRRGAITHWLRSDVPIPAVSSRCNTDPAVIETHYDERNQKELAEQRRKWLDQV